MGSRTPVMSGQVGESMPSTGTTCGGDSPFETGATGHDNSLCQGGPNRGSVMDVISGLPHFHGLRVAGRSVVCRDVRFCFHGAVPCCLEFHGLA